MPDAQATAPFATSAAGSGRRASLLTDYTFGVWDNGELVPIVTRIGHLVGNDQVVLRIGHRLYVIADDPRAAATGGHRPSIGVGQ